MKTIPRPGTGDALLALAVAAASLALAAGLPAERAPDPLGAVLLGAGCLGLAWRRRFPLAVLAWYIACILPYQFLHYRHEAAIPGALLALYSVGVSGGRRRSAGTAAVVGALVAGAMPLVAAGHGPPIAELAGALGWVTAAVVLGEAVRSRRAYVGAILDRAERAERTREQEAARAVTLERLRIARDLYDLLAHSITVIGVQAAVAAHLAADPAQPLDRATLVQTLDTIADGCRDARLELRATLSVLRGSADDPRAALPGEAGLRQLVDSVRVTGLDVTLHGDPGPVPLPSATGAAVYRITQEALTNVLNHADASRADVTVIVKNGRLRLTVTDDGRGGPPGDGGYGIIGMAEWAHSVGGTLIAGPQRPCGFAADLPLPRPVEAP